MEVNIEELKAKYGPIRTVTIPLDSDDPEKVAVFHCRKPTLKDRKMISDLANGQVYERSILAGFNALRVAGDPVEILNGNDDGMVSAENALQDLLSVQRATIKKN